MEKIKCPICGTELKVTVTTSRRGKHAIGVSCPQDGRHFRGFINHQPYVREVLDQAIEFGITKAAGGDGK